MRAKPTFARLLAVLYATLGEGGSKPDAVKTAVRISSKPKHHLKAGGRKAGVKNKVSCDTKLACLELIEDPIYRKKLPRTLPARQLRLGCATALTSYSRA